MTTRNDISTDPTRRRVMREQNRAREQGLVYVPTAAQLSDLIAQACEEIGGVELYAESLGCAPGVLRSVIEGRRRPQGCMLDAIGLEWIKGTERYADPLLDNRAAASQRTRLFSQLGFGSGGTRGMAAIARKRAAAGQPPLFNDPPPPSTGEVVPFRPRSPDAEGDLKEVLGRT